MSNLKMYPSEMERLLKDELDHLVLTNCSDDELEYFEKLKSEYKSYHELNRHSTDIVRKIPHVFAGLCHAFNAWRFNWHNRFASGDLYAVS